MFLQDSITYTIVGNQRCQEAFYINPRTGEVHLGQYLLNTNDAQFDVSIVFEPDYIAFNLMQL